MKFMEFTLLRVTRSIDRVREGLGAPHSSLDDHAPFAEARCVDLRSHRLENAARQYWIDTLRWLRAYRAVHPNRFTNSREPDPSDPLDVVDWFASLIRVKVQRALKGRGDWPIAEIQTDPNGSAKITLIAVDRSIEAWQGIARHGNAEAKVAHAFVARLEFVGMELGALFPAARQFVRPGFDEGWRRALRALTRTTDREGREDVPA